MSVRLEGPPVHSNGSRPSVPLVDVPRPNLSADGWQARADGSQADLERSGGGLAPATPPADGAEPAAVPLSGGAESLNSHEAAQVLRKALPPSPSRTLRCGSPEPPPTPPPPQSEPLRPWWARAAPHDIAMTTAVPADTAAAAGEQGSPASPRRGVQITTLDACPPEMDIPIVDIAEEGQGSLSR